MFRTNGYVQDERYIASEHRDVRRDCVKFARVLKRIATGCADPSHSNAKNRDQLRRSLLQSL